MKKLLHFSGLEKYINTKHYYNIVLSWNLNNADNFYEKINNKKIIFVSKIWDKNKKRIKNKVIKIRKPILKELCRELNKINKINYSFKAWEILLEPWLSIYIESNYFKWILIEEIYKSYPEFKYLKININKDLPEFDTLQYTEKCFDDDLNNHLTFQKILSFKKLNKHGKIINKKKIYKFNKKFFCRNVKHNIFFLIYEKLIHKLSLNKVLIHIRTKKINFLNLCFRLKTFPFKGTQLFDRRLLINIFNTSKYSLIERKKINIPKTKLKNFDNYIFEQIKFDLPLCIIEDFHKIKNLHKDYLQNISLVITDTIHRYNTIFKSWLAEKKNFKKDFKIVTSDHGGIYGNGLRSYSYDKNIADINIKFRKTISSNQISLPSLFLNKESSSHIKENKILIIGHDTSKYPRNFFTGPISEQIMFQYKQVKRFIKNFKNKSNKKIFIRPYLINNGWKLTELYQKTVGKKKIVSTNASYEQLKKTSLIKIVTYPKTAYLESLIDGPTFLLINKKHYNDNKFNQKFMGKLFKNKLAFEDGKKLAEHLIKIENNLDEWWYQSKIQRSIKLFFKNTNIIDKDPISKWVMILKKLL